MESWIILSVLPVGIYLLICWSIFGYIKKRIPDPGKRNKFIKQHKIRPLMLTVMAPPFLITSALQIFKILISNPHHFEILTIIRFSLHIIYFILAVVAFRLIHQVSKSYKNRGL